MTLELCVSGQYVYFRNLTNTIVDKLDDHFSVFFPNYWFMPSFKQHFSDGKFHFYNKTYNRLPGGLVPLIEEFLIIENIPYEKRDTRQIKPLATGVDFSLVGAEERSYQIETVKTILSQKAIIANSATNAGKTELAAIAIKIYLESGFKVLWIVHRKALMRQTAKRLMRRLSLKESDIGLIGDGAFDPEKQLTISMIQTLSRLAIGKEKANSKVARKLLEECDAVIVDEVHHGKSDSYYKTLMKMPAVYRLGLSGTALKQKELDLMRIKAAISSNVCVITNDFLIQEGYSAKPTIYLHTIENMTIDKKTPSRDELLYEETEDERGEPQKELVLDERGRSIVVTPGVYRIGVINNDGFNEQVADIAKKDSKIGNVLIIVNRTEHGENILAKLDKRFKADLIFSELGTEEVMQKLENFRTGKTEILISTPLVDEGLDLPNIKILILAAGGESPSQLLQRVGRGLRKKGGDNRLYVHDFINCCHHLLLSQSIKRFDEYVNEKFEIIQDGVRLEG